MAGRYEHERLIGRDLEENGLGGLKKTMNILAKFDRYPRRDTNRAFSVKIIERCLYNNRGIRDKFTE
jgi:hypothetical protein